MSKKSWKNKDLNKNPSIQKFSWKKVKIYNTFQEADAKRKQLKADGKVTKIRRCGSRGIKFKVLTGEKLKTDNK